MPHFVKTNQTPFCDALVREAEGLEVLRSALEMADVTDLRIPALLAVESDRLTMTRIDASPASDATLALLGDGLARLHALPQDQYGGPADNYIGLSPQPNTWSSSWGDFFVEHRLGYQVGRIKSNALRGEFQKTLDDCGDRLAQWLDRHCEHPSLLHGDLWSGNVLFDRHQPWLIDPAVYRGDREADLAMTEMFGGFGQAFYEAYDRRNRRTEVYPLKRSVYNLYHYLNHYNLFGRGYLEGCRDGMRDIEGLAGRLR
ncbi:MAG: fructosamine kinase family protein [Pseudomonadota bacterium]